MRVPLARALPDEKRERASEIDAALTFEELAGGSISRQALVSIFSARTIAVAGCQSVASSCVDKRNPRRGDSRFVGIRGRCRTRERRKVARPGNVNWPKAPAMTSSFARALWALPGGPEAMS